jgi:hypothetical protein
MQRRPGCAGRDVPGQTRMARQVGTAPRCETLGARLLGGPPGPSYWVRIDSDPASGGWKDPGASTTAGKPELGVTWGWRGAAKSDDTENQVKLPPGQG